MNIRRLINILVHAFIGWALCAATMGIGMATTSLQNALIAHAIGAPIYFTIVSLIYFNKFNYTTPLQSAIIFVGFVVTVDFFVVALVINRSLEMFASFLGTWIPFALIFTSTYLTGLYTVRSPKHKTVAQSREHGNRRPFQERKEQFWSLMNYCQENFAEPKAA